MNGGLTRLPAQICHGNEPWGQNFCIGMRLDQGPCAIYSTKQLASFQGPFPEFDCRIQIRIGGDEDTLVNLTVPDKEAYEGKL